jgi:hypothetical protein
VTIGAPYAIIKKNKTTNEDTTPTLLALNFAQAICFGVRRATVEPSPFWSGLRSVLADAAKYVPPDS